MIKGHWQKVVPLAYSLPFFTAKVKQALDHKLYSSALKKTVKNPAPLVGFQSPLRYNTLLSNIYDSGRPLSLPKQH